MRSEDLARTGARVRFVGILLVLGYLGLAARAAHLTVIDTRGAERGRAQTGTVLRLAPARGLVTDRFGAELAVTVRAPSVYAVPRTIQDKPAVARQLAAALGVETSAVLERLERDRSFVFVRRWITEDEAEALSEREIPGVGIVREPRRAYPMGELAGRMIGFANIDGEGARGVEQGWDGWLRGQPHQIAVERDARGRLLAPAGYDPRASAGGDIALALDAALQADAEQQLAESIRATGADAGTIIVLDPRQGDVLALAEWPPFDPADFRTTPYTQTRSPAFLDGFEPGSSLKPIVVAAALEGGVLETTDGIDCEEGRWRVPGKTLQDTKPHGVLDPAGVLRVSSNIGSAKIGYRLGATRHERALRDFGFGRTTGSGFPDEAPGLLRPSADWQPVDHATISFGQGISVTAMQMAASLGVLAGDGVHRAPRLVVARREPGAEWQSLTPEPPRRVVEPAVARTLREMLGGVVSGEKGTGSYAALSNVAVGGKTGTAQKLDPATGSYSGSRYLAWFVGMAPLSNPEIVAVVMLDEPKGRLHSGGMTAAPLFARVVASALARRGILGEPVKEMHPWARIDLPDEAPIRVAEARPQPSPPKPVSREIKPRRGLPELARLGDRVFLPDLTDLTDVQVRRWARDLPFPLVIRGQGFAVSQQPAAGTVVARGDAVRVSFEEGG